MYKTTCILILLFLVPCCLLAQRPNEGASLPYRIAAFEVPMAKHPTDYSIEVAAGNYGSQDSFEKNIIIRKPGTTGNIIIAEVPAFGASYTWRVVHTGEKNTINKGVLRHFSTAMSPDVDTSITRLRITQKATKYKDAYVFLDGRRALYDMQGKPVWHMPDIKGTEGLAVRDLKITPQGTITFVIDNQGAYEISYYGDILWQGPNNGNVSGDTTEDYHHELTRLANGHYMVAGNEHIYWHQPAPQPEDSTKPDPRHPNHEKMVMDRINRKMPFGTLIEYNEKGKVVWSWKSATYFRNSDVVNYSNPNGSMLVDVHENSFYFDEKNSVIYVGFKNISRILKVKYPEGNVLSAYGETYGPGMQVKTNPLFCYQHSAKVTETGDLLMMNNNSCNLESVPKVLILRQPATEKDSLRKIWEFDCPVEPLSKKLPARLDTKLRGGVGGAVTIGGNVVELPDQSVFASVPGPENKIFIVGKDKRLLWCAAAEKWSDEAKKWVDAPQYRASMVTAKQLEQLVTDGIKR